MKYNMDPYPVEAIHPSITIGQLFTTICSNNVTNEFDNDRKRMSIVLRDLQTKKIIFFCKGADSSMLERADPASIERSGDFTKTIDAYAVRISAF